MEDKKFSKELGKDFCDDQSRKGRMDLLDLLICQ